MKTLTKHGRSHLGQGADKHKPICLCGAVGIRNDKFDSYFCAKSKVWLEPEPSPDYIKLVKCGPRPETAKGLKGE